MPDGKLSFWRPNGQPLPEVPPTVRVPADVVEGLRARHEAEGLRIDGETGKCGWLGERLDLGYAMDVLHPLAATAEPAQPFPALSRLPSGPVEDERDDW
ncbi:MAG TPA: hypothetical protein VNN07_09050 [Candidatus Tectomicrobia bacterium]|nr:hypothetical protein [Candidatus Tectomicrobia bacterium]